jgi:hypothetical protein
VLSALIAEFAEELVDQWVWFMTLYFSCVFATFLGILELTVSSILTTSAAVGNGGKTDKYVWTQQLGDLSVSVPVPAGTKTKMLDVKITNTRLTVRHFFCAHCLYYATVLHV